MAGNASGRAAGRPSAASLERALALSAEWHDAASSDALAELACSSLRALIPCDAAGWNEIDLDGRIVRFRTDPPIEVPAEALNRLIVDHPVLRHALETGDLEAHAISDFLDAAAFHATPLYRELYARLGVEDQLAAAVEVDGDRVVAVAVDRGERSFTREERRLLDLVRPHLASAYERVTRRAAARERRAALEAGLGEIGHTIAYSRNGVVAEAADEARELLERWFGRLPTRVRPGEYERGGARLVVREVGYEGARVVLLDETRLVSPDRASQYGLTQRETEVLALAARGFANREIGARLRISARTVHKHLENVYAKLGVRTRADALERLAD